MRFWDSSAIVPLLVTEGATERMTAELERDSQMIAWWGSLAECVSALSRLEREGHLAGASMAEAVNRLLALGSAWSEVQPTSEVRRVALRLVRVHPLRAADALQLAAALAAAENQPATLDLITLDDRLAEAAGREGFRVVGLVQ